MPPTRPIPVLTAILALTSLSAVACAPAPTPPADPLPQEMFPPRLGIDLSAMERTETGLYIQTLRSGDGPVAEVGDQAVLHYEAWFPDGTRFDSSRARSEPLEIPVGMGRVIDAWDQGLVGMRVGELRRLVVPPELGYGEQGVPGGIPPNATLIFEIELLGLR